MSKTFIKQMYNFLSLHIPPIYAYSLFIVMVSILLFYFAGLSHAPIQAELFDFYVITFRDHFFLTAIFHNSLLALFIFFLPRQSFQKYVFVRFGSKLKWFKQTCIMLFFVSFFYLFGIIFLMLLMSGLYLTPGPDWGDYALNYFQITKEQIVVSPIPFFMVQFILILLFTYIVALLFLIGWIITQNSIAAFAFPVVLYLLSISSIQLPSMILLSSYFPLNQLYQNPANMNIEQVFTSFIILLFYIIALLAIGAWYIQRRDLAWGKHEIN